MPEMPPKPHPESMTEETLQHGLQEFQRHFELTPEELDALIILLNRAELEAIAEWPITVYQQHPAGGSSSILERIKNSLNGPKELSALRALYAKLKPNPKKIQ